MATIACACALAECAEVGSLCASQKEDRQLIIDATIEDSSKTRMRTWISYLRCEVIV
jgi:hypothetical protein